MALFCYYNQEPTGKKKNDCVTRAISLACNMPYTKVRKKLFHTAKLLDCEKLCVSCYSFFIQEVLRGKPTNCDNMTINDFENLHRHGTYLIRIDGHLTTLIDGTVYDIWDCRNRKCTNVWEIR